MADAVFIRPLLIREMIVLYKSGKKMPDRRTAVLCQKNTSLLLSEFMCSFYFPAGPFSDDDISAVRICRVFHNDASDNAVADDFSTCGGIGLDGGSRSGGKVVDGIARHEGI